MTAIKTERPVTTERRVPKEKKVGIGRLLLIAGIMAIVVGVGSVGGAIFGAWYTYDQAAAQNVVTPDDAAIPETAVRGPFTMWAQADIITHHQLESTGGLYFAEMERTVPQLDESGEAVLDENGEAVTVPNEARATWVTATTLITALGLGIVSYALAAFAFAVGATLIMVGYTFLRIRKRAVLA